MIDLPEGPTDAGFAMTLRNKDGAHSHLSACKLNHIDDRELRAIGDLGSYVSKSIDIQAQDLFAGKRPADDLAAWGYEPEANWGRPARPPVRCVFRPNRIDTTTTTKPLDARFGNGLRPRSQPRQEPAHSRFSTPHAKARLTRDRFHSEPGDRPPTQGR